MRSLSASIKPLNRNKKPKSALPQVILLLY